GQSDVEQNDVGMEPTCGGDRACTVPARCDVVAPGLDQLGYRRARILVVVDDEHAALAQFAVRSVDTFRDLRALQPFQFLRAGERQMNGDLAAMAETVALRLDTSSVQRDDALDQRQPDTQAGAAAGAAIDLHERLEHMLQHVGRDADAVIADTNHGLAVFPDRNIDPAARLAVAAPIRQQIYDPLPDAGRVHRHLNRDAGGGGHAILSPRAGSLIC